MKFIKKIRFWGGLSWIIQPFIFGDLPREWISFGIVLMLTAFIDFHRLSRMLTGKNKS